MEVCKYCGELEETDHDANTCIQKAYHWSQVRIQESQQALSDARDLLQECMAYVPEWAMEKWDLRSDFNNWEDRIKALGVET